MEETDRLEVGEEVLVEDSESTFFSPSTYQTNTIKVLDGKVNLIYQVEEVVKYLITAHKAQILLLPVTKRTKLK